MLLQVAWFVDKGTVLTIFWAVQIAGAGIVKKRAPKEPVLDRVALRAGTMLPTSATHRRMLQNRAHLFAVGNTEMML